jgi:hypothetical protein
MHDGVFTAMPVESAPLPDRSYQALCPAELQAAVEPTVDWLWHGYLSRGSVTLLTSPWKAGKTTLLAALLAKLQSGGELAGRAVPPGKAIVISEESKQLWAKRCAKLAIGPQALFICRPFRGLPRPEQWRALLDHLFAIHQAVRFDLLVIDPLAEFLAARGESSATVMLSALAPLQLLTEAGVAVLILHHPRKQPSAAGQWARGSGALSGCADILLEMHYYATADSDDRRRKLLAFSRHEETPRRLVIALDEAGTDWLALGDIEEEEFALGWKTLQRVMESATDKRTRPELLADWPVEEAAPSPVTLYRWLERSVASGGVLRDGTGRANDPFRYWLKGQEEKWRATNPLWDLLQQDRQAVRDALGPSWQSRGRRPKPEG